jgi:hypothetical protein
MAPLRRVLPRIAVTWLLCQVATLTLVPVLFWSGTAEELLECKCTHGDHAICPMHHKPAPGSSLCVMQSADDHAVAVFSWLSNLGLLPRAMAPVVPEPQRAALAIDVTTASPLPAPPDPPPPRT